MRMGNEHPLILAYGYYLKHEKDVKPETENAYIVAARKILKRLEERGTIVMDELQPAHHSVKYAYEHGGLRRAMGSLPKNVHTTEINALETFLSRGYPKAQRWHDATVRTLQRALSYLERPGWQLHVAPLVFQSSGGFRVRKPKTQEALDAVKFINEVGSCVDCGISPMEKGVIRQRLRNRRSGDASMYLAVSCGETSIDGNACQRGWRATAARLNVEDSLIEHNPEYTPDNR